jgi:hypothetical protein
MKRIIEQNDKDNALLVATVIQISDDASLAALKVTSEIPHNLLARSADDEFHIEADLGLAYDARLHTLPNQNNHTYIVFDDLPPPVVFMITISTWSLIHYPQNLRFTV